MSVVDDLLEWHSVMDALSDIQVEERAPLGKGPVVAYTDGACIKNPGGPAGWSAILLSAADVAHNKAREGAKKIERYGYIPKSPTTTNNRAEIAAVLAVLSIAPRDQPLTIYSDSEYTIKVAQGEYKMKANPDLWSLYKMLVKHRQTPPTFEWVRGHAGHDLNELADELAGLGAWNKDYEAYTRWQNPLHRRRTTPHHHRRRPHPSWLPCASRCRSSKRFLTALILKILASDPMSANLSMTWQNDSKRIILCPQKSK